MDAEFPNDTEEHTSIGSGELSAADLTSITRMVGGATETSEILSRLTSYLAGRLDAGGCACFALVGLTSELELECQADAFEPKRLGARIATRELPTAISRLFKGPPVDPLAESGYGEPFDLIELSLFESGSAGIAVPLMFHGQAVGFVWLGDHPDGRPLTPGELALARCAAVYAGQAVGLHRLRESHRMVERQRSALERARRDAVDVQADRARLRETDSIRTFQSEARHRLADMMKQLAALRTDTDGEHKRRFDAVERRGNQLVRLLERLGEDLPEPDDGGPTDEQPILVSFDPDGELDELVALIDSPDTGEADAVPIDPRPLTELLGLAETREEVSRQVKQSLARGWFVSVVLVAPPRAPSDVTQVLRFEIEAILDESTRASEPAGHWKEGGYLCLLPAASSYAARLVANRIRKQLAGGKWTRRYPCVLGVATIDPRRPVGVDALLEQAEQAVAAATQLNTQVVVVPPAAEPAEVPRQTKLLIVDDNKAILRRLKRHFSRSGRFEVTIASSVTEALASARKQPPEAAILDLRLNDGTGFELLRRLRKITGDSFPAIAFTGMADERVTEKAQKIGFDACVEKGDMEPLERELERFLN